MFVFRSLQWRLVSIFIAFAIVLVIVVGVVLNFTVQASYYDTFKKRNRERLFKLDDGKELGYKQHVPCERGGCGVPAQ